MLKGNTVTVPRIVWFQKVVILHYGRSLEIPGWRGGGGEGGGRS